MTILEFPGPMGPWNSSSCGGLPSSPPLNKIKRKSQSLMLLVISLFNYLIQICRLCSFYVVFAFFNVVFAFIMSSLLFYVVFAFLCCLFFMSSLLFLCRLCFFMSSLLKVLVVFVLFNWLRHLHKTGNGIINMWPNFLVSWSVVNWPSLR